MESAILASDNRFRGIVYELGNKPGKSHKHWVATASASIKYRFLKCIAINDLLIAHVFPSMSFRIRLFRYALMLSF